MLGNTVACLPSHTVFACAELRDMSDVCPRLYLESSINPLLSTRRVQRFGPDKANAIMAFFKNLFKEVSSIL